MDCSPSDSSVHGIFQAGILEWVLLQGIFPIQGLHLHLLCLLHRQGDSLPVALPGKQGLGSSIMSSVEGQLMCQ